MGQANYSAAKEGIVGFTRTVARDMGKYGVTCNAIRPNAGTRMTLTPELKAAFEKAKAQGSATLDDNVIKMLEQATPEMIAPLVVWLATDEAANINGSTFFVGGGTIGIYREPEVVASISEQGKVWSLEELVDLMPKKVIKGVVNPAPPQSK